MRRVQVSRPDDVDERTFKEALAEAPAKAVYVGSIRIGDSRNIRFSLNRRGDILEIPVKVMR